MAPVCLLLNEETGSARGVRTLSKFPPRRRGEPGVEPAWPRWGTGPRRRQPEPRLWFHSLGSSWTRWGAGSVLLFLRLLISGPDGPAWPARLPILGGELIFRSACFVCFLSPSPC